MNERQQIQEETTNGWETPLNNINAILESLKKQFPPDQYKDLYKNLLVSIERSLLEETKPQNVASHETKLDPNYYECVIADLPLNGHRPEFVLLDKDGNSYLTIQDISLASHISPGYLRTLASSNRLITKSPNEKVLFISPFSVKEYIEEGRERKRKPLNLTNK